MTASTRQAGCLNALRVRLDWLGLGTCKATARPTPPSRPAPRVRALPGRAVGVGR